MSLSDVRREIDRLDHDIVKALALRGQYVHRAASFKTSESAVRAPDRVREVITERRRWAQEEGVSAQLIDDIFRAVVDHFISEEVDQWKDSKA